MKLITMKPNKMMERPQDHQGQSRYLTMNEVAAQLRVSRRTVYRWIRMGELQVVHIGGTKRIDQRDIDQKKGIYECDR